MNLLCRHAAWSLALFLIAAPGHAHDLLGVSWPSGNIPLRLQLDATAPRFVTLPLMDGASSWNSIALAAMSDWNAVLARSRLTGSTSSAADEIVYGDGVNHVGFSAQAYGMAFPSRFLAVTYIQPLDNDRDQVRAVEADVIVNTEYTWNSYRGTVQSAIQDLRRVLVHEFGHVLGLSHPDEASPRQDVTAIMNSSGGRVETVQADDRAGVDLLYSTPFSRPLFTTQPVGRTVDAAAAVTLAVGVDGQTPPVVDLFHSYRWYFKAPGEPKFERLFTLHRPGDLAFNLAQPLDSGDYYYQVVTPDHTLDSAVATLTVNPLANTRETGLANLSTRGVIGNGVNSVVVGFAVTGLRAKSVLMRAVGPTLRLPPFNLQGTVRFPQLTVKNSAAVTVATSAALWEQSPNLSAIREATARVGAFGLATGSRDAVILTTLEPGTYTVQTSTPGDIADGGVVLVEVYDADVRSDGSSRLANLSSRSVVGSDPEQFLIAGFVVTGPGPRTYLVRAIGDTLKDFGVSGTLNDPVLKLFRSDGTLARETDDWDSPAAIQPALRAAFQQVGAFALTDRQECAMLVTLPPGSYTAQVSGWIGATTTSPSTGAALVEIYEMP